ncbi:MAG: mannose-6-phosphate isomerase, class I [Propionibacteriaceae bacterium]|jgi:mannose-6-phosphate isomerase|nr:mannose-6-phosphate isomerase, class I [Propionibacteriaceae bacterium]
MFELRNPVQAYAWGSEDAIPELLGTKDTGEPQAEMWLGAHKTSPSEVVGAGMGLDEFIAEYPETTGGKGLPFLMKVLAAAAPLSLQVHPTKAQAEAGFERENAEGVSLLSPLRNYKDANHKPEMLIALKPFSALCGFREPADAADALTSLLGKHAQSPFAMKILDALASGDIKSAFLGILEGGADARTFVRNLSDNADWQDSVDASTVKLLSKIYKSDPGVAAALLLNRVELAPGEAVFMNAGVVHAYLHGIGIECMATSDNVLRGGLTSKHIDIPELAKVVNFTPTVPTRVEPKHIGPVLEYQPPTDEFAVEDVRLEDVGYSEALKLVQGPLLLLVLEGEAILREDAKEDLPGEETDLALKRGESVFIPKDSTVFATARSCRFVIAHV